MYGATVTSPSLPAFFPKIMSFEHLRLHIDIAYYSTCFCVMGLALERYILICRYNDAKFLLLRANRVKFFLISLFSTGLCVAVHVLENDDTEAWLSSVTHALYFSNT